MKDYLNYVHFKGKRFILHNFLPDSVFQKRNDRVAGDVIKFIAVGNLKEAKNYYYLLEIFKHLKDTKVSLDIVGKGTLHEKLKAYIDHEGFNVRLCGSINHTSPLLGQYDFFIQASSHEGFGLSVLEAMACNIPVILSDIPVFRETTNNLASFFPLDNAGKAAEIIRATLSNKELYVLTREAFDYARHNYSAGSYRQKLLDIYKEITIDHQNASLFITSPLSI
jgi:glycosyltransferase involved in cell wall biosynthesis